MGRGSRGVWYGRVSSHYCCYAHVDRRFDGNHVPVTLQCLWLVYPTTGLGIGLTTLLYCVGGFIGLDPMQTLTVSCSTAHQGLVRAARERGADGGASELLDFSS